METLGKDQERVHGVALVIRAFGVIAVRRKRFLEIRQEPGFPSFREYEASVVVLRIGVELIERNAVQRALDQLVVSHDESDHADGRAAPGAVVVDAIEELRIRDRDVIRKRSKEVFFERLPFFRRQKIVNGIVSLAYVHEPVRIVEALPEQFAPRVGSLLGMQGQIHVHRLVLEQHVADVVGVLLVLQDLVQRTGFLDDEEVALVPFVRIAAGIVQWNWRVDPELNLGIHFRFDLCYRGVEQRYGTQRRPDLLDTILGHDQFGMLAGVAHYRNQQGCDRQ